MSFTDHIFLTGFSILAACPANAERIIRVEPGLWEYSHTLAIPGVVTPSGQKQAECIRPEEAQRNLSELLAKLTTGDAKCSVSNLKDTLNTVEFDLNCTPEIDALTITSNGHAAFKYGRTLITGNATGKVFINGKEMPVNGTGIARRVGRCPKK